MKQYYAYYVILEPSSDGFGAFFPDLPGTASGGVNFEDAVFSSKECLALHLHGMEEDGDPIPAPSTRDEIEVPDGCRLALVSIDMKEYYPDDFPEENRGGARVGAGRPRNSGRQANKRLVVRMTDEEDELLTRLATEAQKNKSEFIRDLIAAQA